MKKPKPIKSIECSSLKMVSGNETKHPTVIQDGMVKEWVGFGWIDDHKADDTDYKMFPEVID